MFWWERIHLVLCLVEGARVKGSHDAEAFRFSPIFILASLYKTKQKCYYVVKVMKR